MVERDGANATGAFGALSPESRRRLRLFSIKLLFIAVLSPPMAAHQAGYPLLRTIFVFCFWNGICAGLAALLLRQRYNAGHLTAWDEMSAFIALALLTRCVGAVFA